NLNQIRSIIRDHGNLIDRHTIMARSAIMGVRKHELVNKRRLWMDRLFICNDILNFISKDYVERWLKFKSLQMLAYFGYIPPETFNMIEEFR
ncbi:unnamed protein product, partial [Didymodactylos carnosus]